MRQDKDRTAKWLITHHGDSILWLAGIHGFTSCQPVTPETVAPRRLPDGLLEVRFPGDPDPTLVLVEIEAYPGNDVDPQVFEDILAVELVRKVTPEVVCLVLKPKGNLVVSGSRTRTSRRGLTSVSASWQVVNLWTLDAETLLAANDPGLIPWVPLARTNRPADEVLIECRDRLEQVADANDRSGLQVVTGILASFALSRKGLEKLFSGGKPMIDSPLLHELIEQIEERAEKRAEAKAEAKAEALAVKKIAEMQAKLEAEIQTKLEAQRANVARMSISATLEARFGSVPESVRTELASITDANRLEAMIRIAATCPDVATFAAAL